MKLLRSFLMVLFALGLFVPWARAQETITIGLNYPKTGPYSVQGDHQYKAAQLAVSEINAKGGIMGKKIKLVIADTQSKAAIAAKNANKMIQQDGAKMIFGGSASSVAIAVGKVAHKHETPFFGTLTYSTATTGVEGNKYVFRECYDSGAAAKVLGKTLNDNYKGKKYFYITARYTWGYTTESSFRKITNTTNLKAHGRTYTRFPGATKADFEKAIDLAVKAKPDVLVLVLFGKDMSTALKIIQERGLKAKFGEMIADKSKFGVLVPNLTLGMAESAGPQAMEHVVGALPWAWNVPQKYGYKKGIEFVKKFKEKYNAYPSTSSASAYTILHEYKSAVERAKSFDGPRVVAALEGHKYTLLKDEQQWRAFDHQSVQTVYAVRGKPAEEVKQSDLQQDYFEIIEPMEGSKAFITEKEWKAARKAKNKPLILK